MMEIVICSNRQREVYYGDECDYLYIPLSLHECSLLHTSIINAALRIKIPHNLLQGDI